ncbi:hypothetical protein CVT25_015074 [Psilocybe cyanescens]|uniref:Uncharacterized protein n=1 Tax=Psilocybe cyanescens TaxID=93625 RepID=A0A409WRZ2_PSICY|nr:hypothetical protein CVT25_015074 [Psilocybe cyanescens]
MLPALPVELVDDIIDEASRTLDISSVSSIALTSHSFRIRANKTRFSSLVPSRKEGYDIKHTSKRLQTLADIIGSGQSIYTMPGVCEFATSFSLHMIGYHDLVMPALNNGNLVYIFNHLFRPSDATYTQSTTRSLSLCIYRWSRASEDEYSNDGDGDEDLRYVDLSWRSMNLDLATCIQNLIQLSELNRLSLKWMRHIPRDLLRGSNIKYLQLHGVSVAQPGSYHRNEDTAYGEPLLLESLSIDSFVSSTDIGLMTLPSYHDSASTHNLFPCLTRLTVSVSHSNFFKELDKVLYNAPDLRSLAVSLFIDHVHFSDDWYQGTSSTNKPPPQTRTSAKSQRTPHNTSSLDS